MNRVLVQGVGVNDADYAVRPRINGRQIDCPFYRVWKGMLQRAYDKEYHARNPSYLECTVTLEWHLFSTFRAWMKEQDWQGNSLDKDIISSGNKMYSPANCCFVSIRINTLLTDCNRARGDHPIGVYLKKSDKKFRAYCNNGTGKQQYLGVFDTAEEAHQAYCIKKAEVIRKSVAAEENLDQRAKKSLLDRANQLENIGSKESK